LFFATVESAAAETVALLLAGFAAGGTALGFVLQAFLSIESLLAFCKYEFLIAVFAN